MSQWVQGTLPGFEEKVGLSVPLFRIEGEGDTYFCDVCGSSLFFGSPTRGWLCNACLTQIELPTGHGSAFISTEYRAIIRPADYGCEAVL